MKERTINNDITVLADHQSAIISEPGKSSLNFPTSFISSQLSAITILLLFVITAIRANQLNATLLQSSSKRVAVIALVSDQTPGFVPRPALCFPGNIDIFQCLFEQRRFVRAHKYLSYEMAFRKFAARIKQSDFFSAYKIFSDHV